MGEFFDKTKGKIKQALDKATGNDKLVAEGKVDVAKGTAKGVVSDAKDTIHKAKNAVKDAAKDAIE